MYLKLVSKSLVTVFIGLTMATVFLSGCSNKNPIAPPSPTEQGINQGSSSKKIKIVAAENFLGEVATAVGGDRVEVTSVIHNPDTDPHDFEPTTDTAKAVSDAQVIVYVGMGYDAWMDKLLKAGPTSQKIINVGNDLLGRKNGDNPHIWYIPDAMPKLADTFAEQLGQIDPGQADPFKKRAQDYIASLAPVNELVTKLKQTSPANIAVSEPVFDYMAQALNLTIINTEFARAIEDESDPSLRNVAELQDAIKGKKIKFFVENKQAESSTVKMMADLANSNKVPIVYVTETEPQGKNYVQWMTNQLLEVQQALGLK